MFLAPSRVVELMIVFCVQAQPDWCLEMTPINQPDTMEACLQILPVEAPMWLGDHPGWELKGWHCRPWIRNT